MEVGARWRFAIVIGSHAGNERFKTVHGSFFVRNGNSYGSPPLKTANLTEFTPFIALIAKQNAGASR